MNVALKMFGEGGKQISVPMPIYRVAKDMLQPIGRLMQVYGLLEASLTVTTQNFFPVIVAKYRSTEDPALPDILKQEQPEIMTALKLLMIRFGMASIKITLDASEQNDIRRYWNYLATGIPSPEDVPLKAGMPKVEDPTGKPVQVKVKVPDDLAALLKKIPKRIQLPAGLGTAEEPDHVSPNSDVFSSPTVGEKHDS